MAGRQPAGKSKALTQHFAWSHHTVMRLESMDHLLKESGNIPTLRAVLAGMRSKDHDSGTERRALVEVDDVLVEHTNAAGGDALTNGPGLVRPVDPVKRILVTLPEIHGAGTEWIARPASDAETASQCAEVFLELGLTLDHFFWRIPIRPFLFVPDCCHAGPSEAV